jgi:hypothetical protein
VTPLTPTPEELEAVAKLEESNDFVSSTDFAKALFTLLPSLGFARREDTLEEAAKVADKCGTVKRNWDDWDEGYTQGCKDLAFAIRQLHTEG